MYHYQLVSPVQHSWSVEVGDTYKCYSPVWVSCHFKSRFWIGQLSSGYVRGLCWYCYLLVVVHKNDSDYIKMTFDYWFLFEALLKDKKKLCATLWSTARKHGALMVQEAILCRPRLVSVWSNLKSTGLRPSVPQLRQCAQLKSIISCSRPIIHFVFISIHFTSADLWHKPYFEECFMGCEKDLCLSIMFIANCPPFCYSFNSL